MSPPTCVRCGQPLDPLASAPSPAGPIHASCAQSSDIARATKPPSPWDASRVDAPLYGAPPRRLTDEAAARGLPAYGLPPPPGARVARVAVVLVVALVGVALIAFALLGRHP